MASDASHAAKATRFATWPAEPGSGCTTWITTLTARTGDVIYCCDGDISKAPYVISGVDDSTGNMKAACTIDCSNAVDVVPTTTYQEEAGR